MTTKLQKIWKLTDESTGLQMATFLRKKLEPFESSTTIIEEQYLITAEKLRGVMMRCSYDGLDQIAMNDLLKELGVEDE